MEEEDGVRLRSNRDLLEEEGSLCFILHHR